MGAIKHRAQSFSQSELFVYKKYIDDAMPNLPIKVCVDYRLTVEKIRNIVKKSNSDVVIVDHMGLIESNNNKSSYERMGEISRELKLMAIETNKVIIVLCQLSREITHRQDKTPKLSDLRDSGRIEEDADMVCFVHRPHYFEPAKYKECDFQFIIGKSRNTESNIVVPLFYNPDAQRIRELNYAG